MPKGDRKRCYGLDSDAIRPDYGRGPGYVVWGAGDCLACEFWWWWLSCGEIPIPQIGVTCIIILNGGELNKAHKMAAGCGGIRTNTARSPCD